MDSGDLPSGSRPRDLHVDRLAQAAREGRWSPDEYGLAPVYPPFLWQRDNRDGSLIFAVVVPPKLLPGWDGGHWRSDELWLVVMPADTAAARTILDKPHRVTYILRRSGVERDDETGDTYDTLGFARSRIAYRGPLPADLRAAVAHYDKAGQESTDPTADEVQPRRLPDGHRRDERRPRGLPPTGEGTSRIPPPAHPPPRRAR